MKEVRSRNLILPFYTGCWNDQAVKIKNPKVKEKPETMEGESASSSSTVQSKKSWSKSDISKVMERLIRSTLKGVTQIFAYKDLEDIESEAELEIGLPTDVKHVTHIGCDGSMTTNPDKNWDHLQPPDTLPFPSTSLEKVEFQMAKVEKRDP